MVSSYEEELEAIQIATEYEETTFHPKMTVSMNFLSVSNNSCNISEQRKPLKKINHCLRDINQCLTGVLTFNRY